ncbi:MAG: FAD-dependent oxidoreductase [Chloroflexota bacterium]|nr:FAD-dependent oxidoreductase [Chloroflexota bacterium]
MAQITRVVIAGAGYAGVRVASRLRSLLGESGEITVADRDASHQLIVRLPEIIGGTISPDQALIPYSRLFGNDVRLVQSEIVKLLPEGAALETAEGEYTGDFLVVALGSAPDYHEVPGAQEHAFPVRSVRDAERLRRRLEQVTGTGETVHVVIVGAGYTGTEVAGEIAEWGKRLQAEGGGGITVTVVAPETRLLVEADLRLGDAAERILRQKGVWFRLGTSVRRVEQAAIELDPEPSCPADVVVWAARARAAPPVLSGAETVGHEGRIQVDPYLRSRRYDRVYLAGDVACAFDYVQDRVVAPSAQMAVREGNLVAENIAAEVRGRQVREFRPRRPGEALSLGGSGGVAEIGGVILTGRKALALKHAALARYLYQLGATGLLREYW